MDIPVTALERKLSNFVALDMADRLALRELMAAGKPVGAGVDLILEGQAPKNIFLFIDGWAVRYKLSPAGRRQILAFLLPGDICDMHIYILKEMDHSIAMLGDGVVVAVSKDALSDVMGRFPNIQRGIWWASLQDDGVMREWLVNVGRRPALQRLAHLFCELYIRMHAIGLLGAGGIALPFTQPVLADALGMTQVHINRTLQIMRADGLIHFGSRHLEIRDFDRLAHIAEFTSNYLHLERG